MRPQTLNNMTRKTQLKKVAALANAKVLDIKADAYFFWKATIYFDNGTQTDIDLDDLKKTSAAKTKKVVNRELDTLAAMLRANNAGWFADKRKAHTRIKVTGAWDAKLYKQLLAALTGHPDVISVEKESISGRGWQYNRVNSGAYRIIIKAHKAPTQIFI